MRYKDLLNTNDILNLLTKRLNFSLKQTGRSVFFRCPFHNDSNPSCSFEPNWKIFTCFSCGFRAGDIFQFWAKYRKISFEEALSEISRYGYFSSSLLKSKKEEKQKVKNKIFYSTSLVADIYQHNLFTKPGRPILSYLCNKRKVDRNIIERFFLGCSISSNQIGNLVSLFFADQEKKNDFYSGDDLLSTNLVWVMNDNKTQDFFSSRNLIFPLTDSEGKIVAFASRKIDESLDKESKYKFLANYQYYHKSSFLYNYHWVRKSSAEECYLVEGFFDVISLTQKGIENCVALLGTNLSEEQFELLRNLKKRIVLFLDNDIAGQKATVNIAIKLLSAEVDCEVVKINYQSDPDEFCRNNDDKEVISNFLHQRENPYLFILDYYSTAWEIKDNPQRISAFINEISKIFQKFKANVRSFLIEKLSLLVKWNNEEVEECFSKWNFPAFNHYHSQITYCWEMITNKERQLLDFYIQNRKFWLLSVKKSNYFWDKANRKKYYNIYNYYIDSFDSSYFKSSSPAVDSISNSNTLFSSQIIFMTFQEIDNTRKFLINYEQTNR